MVIWGKAYPTHDFYVCGAGAVGGGYGIDDSHDIPLHHSNVFLVLFPCC